MLVSSAGVLASACIPIPLKSGYQGASNENIPAQVPDFIVKGKTTRDDVIVALGEPNRSAENGSWALYSSVFSKGGMAVVPGIPPIVAPGVGEEEMRYRLLVVRFDDAGVVSSAELTEKTCTQRFVTAEGSETPCFDVSGDSLVVSDLVAVAAPGEHVVEFYPQVLWWQGRERPPDPTLVSKPTEPGAWADLAVTDGSLVLTPSVSATPEEPLLYLAVSMTGTTRLTFADIKDISANSHQWLPFVTVTLADGSHCSFVVMAHSGAGTSGPVYVFDFRRTKAVGALLQDRFHAATGAVPAVPTPP